MEIPLIFLSVIAVSLIAFIGILFLSVKEERLRRILIYLVSFSAGGLLGDSFIHLIPESYEKMGFTVEIPIYILSGILISFIVEKFIHWRHCHVPTSDEHVHSFAIMNLIGDSIHNFIDGLIIATSYLVNIPLGIATTLAVIFHEIPQEIGDFGILIYGGFSKKKALIINFLTALTSVLGAILALVLFNFTEDILNFLIPFSAGTFIYIAGSDLIPELHSDFEIKKSLLQFFFLLSGITLMLMLKFTL